MTMRLVVQIRGEVDGKLGEPIVAQELRPVDDDVTMQRVRVYTTRLYRGRLFHELEIDWDFRDDPGQSEPA